MTIKPLDQKGFPLEAKHQGLLLKQDFECYAPKEALLISLNLWSVHLCSVEQLRQGA